MSRTLGNWKTGIAICIAVIFAIGQPKPALSQSSVQGRPPEDIQAIAAYLQREMLKPILKSLRRKSQGNRQLLSLLNELRPWVLPEPLPRIGPNAIATHKNGRPVVYFDLIYLQETSEVAGIAGLALTGRDEAGPILYKAGFDYGKSVAYARTNHLRTPALSFKVENSVTDPGLRMIAKRLSLEAFFGGVAWLVLHEVGHHYLGHLERDPRKCGVDADTWTKEPEKASRKCELDADIWAFSMMTKLGYNLAPVHGLLAAHEMAQEIRVMAGAEPSEMYSTHPSYTTRRKELEKRHDISMANQSDWMIFLFGAVNKRNEMFINEIWVPRYPEREGFLLAMTSDGEKTVWMPFDWEDGQIHLYGRDAGRLTETIIHQPNKIKPEMTFKEIHMPDGAVSETKTHGFQVDSAWIQEADLGGDLGGLKVYEAIQSSPRRLFSQALRRVEGRSDIIELAERIQLGMLQKGRQILIRYAQGQLSYAAGQRQFQANAAFAAGRLKVILGSEGYARVRDSLFSNPVVQSGLKQLLLR